MRALQEAAERVHLSAELADYIVAVARETRRSPHLALGVSPRGQLAWRNAARAAALADGRDYVLPDDLKRSSGPCWRTAMVPASPVEALARARSDSSACWRTSSTGSPRRDDARQPSASAQPPTREGWWFLGATLLVGAAAVDAGINLYFLTFGMMVCLVVAGIALSELGLRGCACGGCCRRRSTRARRT